MNASKGIVFNLTDFKFSEQRVLQQTIIVRYVTLLFDFFYTILLIQRIK